MKRILLLTLVMVVLVTGTLRAETNEEGTQSAVEAVKDNAAAAEAELDAEVEAAEKKEAKKEEKKASDEEKKAEEKKVEEPVMGGGGLSPLPPTGVVGSQPAAEAVEAPAEPAAPAVEPVAAPAAAPAPAAAEPPADVAAAGADVAKEAEKEEKPKWWMINLSYTFSHNIAKERPTLSNSFSVDPMFTIPVVDMKLVVHLGVSGSMAYGRKSTVYTHDYRDEEDLKAFHTWDMDPLGINLSRKIWGYKFSDVASFNSSASLALILPFTSEYAGRVPGWNFAYKPGIGAGFRLGDFGINNKVSFQQNFHSDDFGLYDMAGAVLIPRVQFKLSNNLSLSWGKWGVSARVWFGVTRSWKYTYDLDALYERVEGLDYDEARKISMSYGWEIGYAFAGLKVPVLETMSIAVGMSTGGPERINGGFGDDRLYPMDPQFTNVYVSLSSSF